MVPGFIKIGAQDIRYDGVNLSHYFDITDVAMQPFPEIEVKSTKIPGKAGTHFNDREIGERTLTLKMSIRGFDRNKIHIYQFWRELVPLLLKPEPRPMTLDEHKQINVIARSATEIERLGTRGISDIEFVANDPFFYGEEHEIELSRSTHFSVLGGYEVLPTIEITGVSGELIVTNEKTGDRIRIPSVASDGAKVVVDMERNRCTINGEYLPVDMSVTDYFGLPLGEAVVGISKGSGILKYKERYL